MHDNRFGLARYCTILIHRTIFFVHDKIFEPARNRAQSNDKIFIMISNPGPNYQKSADDCNLLGTV